MSIHTILQTPIGSLGIAVGGGKLLAIDFLSNPQCSIEPGDPLAREVHRQLRQYFEQGQMRFSLPLELRGTEFQQSVWRALCRIPPGQVESYGAVARLLGSSARAVGNACRRNPIPLVVPCHRVVSAAGIGGYGGATDGRRIEVKRWLLAHEGVTL